MKSITHAAFASLFLAAATARAEDPAKNPMKSLEGTWQLESRVVNGKAVSPETVRKVRLTIDADGKWKAYLNNEVVLEGSIKLDDSRPNAAEWTVSTSGENEGKSAMAIFAVEGDTLKHCYNAPGSKEMPTKFESTPGSRLTFSTFKRVKK